MEVVIVAVIGIATLWIANCNARTYAQRADMLNALSQNTDYRCVLEQLRHIQTVSYDKHWWYLITFRNPTKLYTQKEQCNVN